MEQKIPTIYVLRLTLGYLLLGSAWIVLSDGLLPFHGDADAAARFSLVKGLAFVAVTSALLALGLSQMPVRLAAASPARLRWWPPLAIIAALGAALLAIAYSVERDARREVEAQTGERLALELRLKSARIAAWLEAQRATGRSVANDPIATVRLRQWLRSGASADRIALQRWLAEKQQMHPHDHFIVIDAEGRRLLDDGLGDSGTGSYPREVQEAIDTSRGLLVDFAQDQNRPALHLSLLTAIAGGAPGERPLLLLQEIDAEASVLSAVEERQDLSQTGESILVRRIGDEVEIVSRPRFPPTHAQYPRLSIKDHPALPAVRVLLGTAGLFHGIDYRDVPVLACGAMIEDTPWALVAKIDEAEAFAQLDRQVRLVAGALLSAWLAGLLLVLLFWQRHRLRLAAEQLRQSNALQLADGRFKQLFGSASVGMSICGLDGRLLDVNPCLCAMTGYRREELVGTEMADIVHPDDRPSIALRMAEQLAGRPSPTIERRYLRRDGGTVPTLHSSSLVRDAAGVAQYFVGVVDDLSALEKSEQALRLSEERFRLAMRATRDGIWDWDLRSGEVYYSPGWKRMLGYGEDEIEGSFDAFLRILRPEDAPRVEAAVEAVASRRAETLEIDIQIRHRDGHYLDIWSRGLPVFGDDGRLRRLIGTTADVSERKTIEASLRERLELQQYVNRVGEMLPGALFKFRRSGSGEYSIPYATASFGKLLELDDRTVREDIMASFHRVHPDDLQAALDAYAAIEPGGPAGRHEYRIVRPTGGTIWIEAHFAADRDPDGGTTWHGFIHDVSERKAREAQVRQAAIVFEGTHEGVMITDPQGTIVAVNRAFSTITGYASDDVRGENVRILKSGRQGPEFYAEMWKDIGELGYWQGEIWNRRKDGSMFPEWITISAVREPNGGIINYVGTFSDITRMKDAEARLEHQARHDVLTGLPNRRGLRDEIDAAIARARRDGRGGALLMLDLDRFKDVNDGLGHAAGDELLTLAAQRLRNAVREVDLLARIGGDEFVVVIEALEQATSAARVAEQLIGAIGRPFLLSGGQEAYVGVSIGIANFDGGSEAGDLLKHADAALYVAKNEGRGTYRFHNSNLTHAAAARLNLEGRLRRALEQQQFEVHYQPLVALADGRVTGVEALLRWHDPELGAMQPEEFIPLAEENGLIVPIGDWVLRTACRDFARWRKAGLPLTTIAVNLSPRQLLQSDIHSSVAEALSESGLAPGYLELEITEGTLVRDAREVNDRLRKLKALGVRIAVDDFGTGYSSLVYLRRFPVDKIKIDRTFVDDVPDDPTDSEIVSAVIALGRILNLEVLAEGIERPEQLEFLTSHGCTTGQGFLFSAAVTADRVERMAWNTMPAPAGATRPTAAARAGS